MTNEEYFKKEANIHLRFTVGFFTLFIASMYVLFFVSYMWKDLGVDITWVQAATISIVGTIFALSSAMSLLFSFLNFLDYLRLRF